MIRINNNFFICFFMFVFSLNVFAHDALNVSNSKKLQLTLDEKRYLEQKKILKIANLNNFPPFSFYRDDHALGYSVDYLKLMGIYLGVDVEFVSGKPWNEYLKMIKEGTIDIIPHIAITEERKNFIDFTKFNHISYSIGFVTKKDFHFKSINDLKSKRIAVANKTFLHSYLKKNFPEINLVVTTTTLNALKKINNNEADAAIGNLPALNYFIQEKWFNHLHSFTIDDLGISSEVQLPMGVKKDDVLLKSILEKTNNIMTYNELVKLKSKWFNNSIEVENKILSSDELEYLNNKKVLKMCIDPNWMPFEKFENGKHIGMSADYINIIQKKINIPIIAIETKSWSESLQFGKERKCDIFSLIMPTEKRKTYLDFTNSYMNIPLVIATKIDEFFINDISSVLNKKLGIVEGYAFAEILKQKYPNIKLYYVKSVDEGMKKVEQGEIFGFVGTLYSVGYSIQKEYVGELKIAGKFEETWDLSIGVRNDETILTSIFNKAIKNITSKDDHEILNRWISINYQKGIDYTKLWQISAAFLLVLLVVLYKNRTVNQVNKELKKANNEIQEQQDMVDKYVLIVNTDLSGNIISANHAYQKATGFEESELIGKTHNIMRHPDMEDKFFENMWKTLKLNKPWDGEIKNFKKNGEICWFNTYIEPLYEENRKVGYRSINEDITDKKRIEELSITDKLTGLYNRLKLDEILSIQIEEYKRYKHRFSIILLDVDDFKIVNDKYGHDFGDKVLQKLSDILKKNIRTTDAIGRWGGEEFVIVCTNTCADNAAILADHLRLLFESEEFDEIGSKTISLGVTEFEENDNISSLFKRADSALYVAKNAGKNQVVLI